MMQRSLGLTAMIVALSLAPGARADSTEAIAHYERAVKLYEQQAYEGALLEFREAYRLSGNYKLLYNIAVITNELKDYPAAIEAYTSYLAKGGAEVPEARRTEVRGRLDVLGQLVGRVTLKTNAPAGAEVAVDEHPVGVVPLGGPLIVKVGRRRVSVTVDGKNAVRSVDVTSAGATVEVPFEVTAPVPTAPTVAVPVASAGVQAPVRPGGEVRVESARSFPWVGWALTGTLGAGALVTGLLAVSARNDLAEKQATYGVTRAELKSADDRSARLGLVTDVLLGCTVVAAGVSTFFTVRYAGDKKDPSAATAALTFTPMGVVLTGGF